LVKRCRPADIEGEQLIKPDVVAVADRNSNYVQQGKAAENEPKLAFADG
jgi:hypothetical protein